MKKPLFIHERDAHEDLLEILNAYKELPPVVVHCFTGTAEQALTYLDKGFYIGLTGNIIKYRKILIHLYLIIYIILQVTCVKINPILA